MGHNGLDSFPNRDFDPNQGYLRCHPADFTNPFGLNVMSRSSYITGYGDIARDAGQFGTKGLRYLCRTNAYGPPGSIFHDCFGKCQKTIEYPYLINNMQSRAANPTLTNPVCQMFVERVVRTNRLQMDFEQAMNQMQYLAIVPARVEISDGAKLLHVCYPFETYQNARNVRSGLEYPYRHGWCSVCERKNITDASQCSDILSANTNWGWCLPECDEPYKQPATQEYPHEVAVDAFVYENCSHGVNTFKEFCTGAKSVVAYTMTYLLSGGNMGPQFTFLYGTPRHFSPGDLAWNMNDPIIRPGSRYQGKVLTPVRGDACYGDAGGSVWRIWAFRDFTATQYA